MKTICDMAMCVQPEVWGFMLLVVGLAIFGSKGAPSR